MGACDASDLGLGFDTRRFGPLAFIGDQNVPFILGIIFGLILLLFGVATGFMAGRRRSSPSEDAGIDRRRILKMLQELGAWTNEYRGGVSRYQDELVEIRRGAAKSAGGESPSAAVLPLVEQIMQTNQQLQQRLEAAEKQLEHQTRQIESYLSEARTDGLTGLANRRAFDKKLDEMFATFKRTGNSFVLALIDIDNFKKINDTYGHQAGDAVLKNIATRMSLAIEDPILVSRFGGEEFAILMPSPLRMATAKLDAFRKACAAESVRAEGQDVKVTVSIGLSETRDDTVIGPLVRRADEALYAAKGIGRNRTYYHDGHAPVLYGAPEVVGSAK